MNPFNLKLNNRGIMGLFLGSYENLWAVQILYTHFLYKKGKIMQNVEIKKS